VNQNSTLPFLLCAWLFLLQCHEKNKGLKLPETKLTIDTVLEHLKPGVELLKTHLVAINALDSNQANPLSETGYCDTTVYLNDSIIYSIISMNDQAGICSFLYVTTINKQSKKVIESILLHTDCDVDFSQDNYTLYSHNIDSNHQIQLTRTEVFQKEKRTSNNEDENIDHVEKFTSFYVISSDGKIIRK